jgi:hypothetical protein
MNTELLKLDLISKILLIEEMGLLMELQEWIEQRIKTMPLSNPYVMPNGLPMSLEYLKNRVFLAEKEDAEGKSIADEDLVITI